MEKPFWEGKEYSFFSHKKCEYFPCHKGADLLLSAVRAGRKMRGEFPLYRKRDQGLHGLPGSPQTGKLRIYHRKIQRACADDERTAGKTKIGDC